MGLGLSNSERGPWALDCPTTYNGRTRVTIGLGAVSKEVAQRRQWKRQLCVFTKAGPTVRQERGTAIPQQQPGSCLPTETDSPVLGERLRLWKALRPLGAQKAEEELSHTQAI